MTLTSWQQQLFAYFKTKTTMGEITARRGGFTELFLCLRVMMTKSFHNQGTRLLYKCIHTPYNFAWQWNAGGGAVNEEKETEFKLNQVSMNSDWWCGGITPHFFEISNDNLSKIVANFSFFDSRTKTPLSFTRLRSAQVKILIANWIYLFFIMYSFRE